MTRQERKDLKGEMMLCEQGITQCTLMMRLIKLKPISMDNIDIAVMAGMYGARMMKRVDQIRLKLGSKKKFL